MHNSPDPIIEIYELMDKAGLTTSGMFNSKKPMAKIVEDVRSKLAKDFKALIERREQGVYTDDNN